MNIDAYKQMDISGKIAIVTGGSGGIGEAISLKLAQAGASVFVVNRNKEKGMKLVDEINKVGKAFHFQADISKINDIEDMVNFVYDKFNRIDILVNCAGVNFKKSIVEVTEEDWDKTLDINLKGLFFCCQKVGKIMIQQRYGKIVNIGSIQGEDVLPLRSSYIASKGGVKQLTKSFATEWAKYNININTVSPGVVKTEMATELLNDKIWKDVLRRKTPMRRPCEPEEIANVVLFFSSDAVSYVNGANLMVDGGWSAGYAVDDIGV